MGCKEISLTTLLGQKAQAREIRGRKRGSTLKFIEGFAGPNTIAVLSFPLCKVGSYPKEIFSVKYMVDYTCRSCNCTSFSYRFDIICERIKIVFILSILDKGS